MMRLHYQRECMITRVDMPVFMLCKVKWNLIIML